jgi:hypothetical protein
MVKNTDGVKGRKTLLQWAMVCGLAAVFIVVLIVQFGSSEASPQPAKLQSAPNANPQQPDPAATRVAEAKAARDGGRASNARQKWPTFDLETVAQYNPFAQGASLGASREEQQSEVITGGKTEVKTEDPLVSASAEVEKKKTDRQQAMKQVRQETVRAIVGTNKGFTAVIGAKSIHVGDRLHGFLVKDIDADGVVLDESGD